MKKIFSFIALFLIACIALTCKCQAQSKKPEQKKDTTIHIILSQDQEAYLVQMEKEMRLLNTKWTEAVMLMISVKDTTYVTRLVAMPIHNRKKISLTVKKIN